MTPDELAHWRYRASSLEQKVKDGPRVLLQAKALQNHFKDSEIDSPVGPSDMDRLREEYHCNQWLLEEARYHVEREAVEDMLKCRNR